MCSCNKQEIFVIWNQVIELRKNFSSADTLRLRKSRFDSSQLVATNTNGPNTLKNTQQHRMIQLPSDPIDIFRIEKSKGFMQFHHMLLALTSYPFCVRMLHRRSSTVDGVLAIFTTLFIASRVVATEADTRAYRRARIHQSGLSSHSGILELYFCRVTQCTLVNQSILLLSLRTLSLSRLECWLLFPEKYVSFL